MLKWGIAAWWALQGMDALWSIIANEPRKPTSAGVRFFSGLVLVAVFVAYFKVWHLAFGGTP